MFSLETVPALVAGGLLYWFPIRRWSKRWGATDVDLARPSTRVTPRAAQAERSASCFS